MPMVITTRAERPVRPFLPNEVLLPSRSKAKPGPCHLLQKTLEQGWHVAQPERKEKNDVLCPPDVFLCLLQACWQQTFFPLSLAAQQWKIKSRHVDAAHQMAGVMRTGGIGVGQSVAPVGVGRVWMPLKQENAFDGHKYALSPADVN